MCKSSVLPAPDACNVRGRLFDVVVLGYAVTAGSASVLPPLTNRLAPSIAARFGRLATAPFRLMTLVVAVVKPAKL